MQATVNVQCVYGIKRFVVMITMITIGMDIQIVTIHNVMEKLAQMDMYVAIPTRIAVV